MPGRQYAPISLALIRRRKADFAARYGKARDG